MKKVLMASLLVALMLVTVLSVVFTANAIDVDNEAIENSEIKPLDDYDEIITFIDGNVWFNDVEIKGSGLIRHLEIWDDSGQIEIRGIKYPLFPLRWLSFREFCTYVIAPRFIGYVTLPIKGICGVKGIALGNIEWS